MAEGVKGSNGKGTKQFLTKLESIHGERLKVGWFEGAHEDDGTPSAYVAAINEFGAPEQSIPARPFMRPTVAAKREQWAKKYAALMQSKGIAGDFAKGLDAMGEVIAADFKRAISDVKSPRLANSTIMARIRRGNLKRAKKMPVTISKPLVDTRMMVDQLMAQTTQGGKK